MSKIVRFLSITLLLTLALGLFVSSNAAATPKDGKLRLFVEYAPGQRGSVQRALQANGATLHYAFDDLNTFAVSIPAAAYQGISRNPNVVFVEEDVLRFPVEVRPSIVVFAPPAAHGSQVVPYGVDMVQARDVWDMDRDDVVDTGAPTGANRTVCIIDFGLLHRSRGPGQHERQRLQRQPALERGRLRARHARSRHHPGAEQQPGRGRCDAGDGERLRGARLRR